MNLLLLAARLYGALRGWQSELQVLLSRDCDIVEHYPDD
jgi:hypothetical protein